MRRFSIFHRLETAPFDKDRHEYVGPFIADGPRFDAHLADLQEMGRILREDLGVPAVAVLFNTAAEREEDWQDSPMYVRLHKRIGEALGGFGFHVVDLYPHYQAEMQRRGWRDLKPWWLHQGEPVDRHPNVDGHRFIASRLLRHILDQPELMAVLQRAPTTAAVSDS